MAAQARGEELVNKLVEKLTLRVYRAGCEPKNYWILTSLPLSEQAIAKALDLTVMPTNRRVNDLKEVGLVYRDRSKKEIHLSELGEVFLQHIETLKKQVVHSMAQLV